MRIYRCCLVGLAILAGQSMLAVPGRADIDPPDEAALAYARNLSKAFNVVAEELGPSVVHITSMRRVWTRQSWFGPSKLEIAPTGLGSGVIISEDGYILTNNHVIDEAEQLLVRLADGTDYEAEVVGTDPVTDLALLNIDAEGLTAAQFGDSDALEVGEWVLAIGSPFGFDNTVTAGIVSAKSRAGITLYDPAFRDHQEFIQTDASINPGNSGGPLVNLEGKIVGINTVIASRSGGSVGVGFATPSAIAQMVIEDIRAGRGGQHGRRGGWLGVEAEPISEDEARALGVAGGVRVESIADETTARILEKGDIVTQIRGRPVRDPRTFANVIALSPPGVSARVELIRNGERRTVRVAIKDREEAELAMMGAAQIREIGLTVAPLTEELARSARTQARQGLVVLRVEPRSIADYSGFEAGDVIVSIGGIELTQPEQLSELMSRIDLREGVRINAIRQGQKGYLVLRQWR